MDVNFNIPTLESESSDPFVLSSPGLLSESELLELLWKKGPVEKPLTMQVPPDPPTLQFGEVEPPFITEDEMAMWLHYPIEGGPSGSGVATVGQRIEPVVLTAEPVQKNRHDAPSMCKEQVGSSNVATTKRKWKETAGLQRHDSEGSDLEAGNKSSRRAHKAKVHNLSERRRRERINEKLKALQELIPRCSKSDKVSMLGDAIGYVKSLQKQVQMMSMGNMRPMIFPGAPTPCMTPPIGLGMNMAGLGMNMNMNMNNMGLGMPPFGPVAPCTQFNTQAVQPTMMQMQHQHGTFPPCHFPPFVVPAGQVQMPSHQSSNNQKTEKGKHAESSLL